MIDNSKRVQELLNFYNLLIDNAPTNYTPWMIPIKTEGKDIDALEIYKRSPVEGCCKKGWKKVPCGKKGDGSQRYKQICPNCGKSRASWKQSWARLSLEEAKQWLYSGGNMGLAARSNDPLVLIDIDNGSLLHTLKPTLIDCSRKRCGYHGFYFKKEDTNIQNIPTEDNGEVRVDDQYVVIAGSYVTTSKVDIDKELTEGHITNNEAKKIKQDPYLGCYTVLNKKPVSTITYDEIPNFFKEEAKKQNVTNTNKTKYRTFQRKRKGKQSGLYKLQVSDIVSLSIGERKGHPLHSSDTDANFCIDENGLGHCWRHNVCLNAIQFLCVKAGYTDCCSAGSGHKGVNASKLTGDKGAIFHAWLQAKKEKYLAIDDPIPYNAIKYVAKKHELVEDKNPITCDVYNEVIKIVEEEY